jgi:hypothetical protein
MNNPPSLQEQNYVFEEKLPQYFDAGDLVCVSNVFSKGEASLEAGEHFETVMKYVELHGKHGLFRLGDAGP